MVNTRSQTKMADNADLLALLAEMKKSMEKGQEEMKNGQEEMKNQIQGVKGKLRKPTVKSLTFDGQTSWTVFKTQFDVVSSANGWSNFVKASQLVTSLRGSAAEVLQGIPSDKLTDLTTIENALEARFGDSHLTQFYRTELKTRRQKPGY
ncbi:hypothetical protein AVEN_221832-1 [Araneus ventricosus]|uniref:Retrotransposon gag domain-containing protein n=1 Tax=Araneus ventricosus TaxID=182803 RepID=A0A4Y2EGF7_ARAVE|nr:hypothetical protein AVEN_96744-1 [Araneus ventricosus]GBM28210.1 hypothetical protein AVEN_221832-1 [Araneus ventricosus]